MSAAEARTRFEAATRKHLTDALTDGVVIRHVGAERWHQAIGPLVAREETRPGVDPRPLFTPEIEARLADLEDVLSDRLEHRLLLEADGEVIGGYWGMQESAARYFMVMTLLARDWRRRGIYSRLLPRVVEAAADSGFREVFSQHRADNNAILVPKLRAGFVIAGFEVNPRFGLTVHLRRYLVEGFRKLHAYRVDGDGAAALRARGVVP